MSTLRKWIGIGLAEVVLSLVLIAIAPHFLNSPNPTPGFLIWLAVPTLLGGSGLYVVYRIVDAQRARRLFISAFPEYAHLSLKSFLAISAAQVSANLEMLHAARDDADFQSLRISLFDLLRSSKR